MADSVAPVTVTSPSGTTRELNGERKQREPRPMFDVRPEPLHADKRLAPEGRDIPAVPTLQYNIARFARGCQP